MKLPQTDLSSINYNYNYTNKYLNDNYFLDL